MILGLVFALVVVAFQQGGFAEPQAAIEQRAHDEYEQHKQAAIRINELAGRIHAESGASSFVSEIAGVFVKELPRWRNVGAGEILGCAHGASAWCHRYSWLAVSP